MFYQICPKLVDSKTLDVYQYRVFTIEMHNNIALRTGIPGLEIK